MAAHGRNPGDLLPMVGDIVERSADTAVNTAQSEGAFRAAATSPGQEPTKALRPIQAVVGQAFPTVRTRHSYGRQSAPTSGDSQSRAIPAGGTDVPATSSSSAAVVATGPYTSLSAHVQPQGGAHDDDGVALRLSVPAGGIAPMLPVGGSAQQHLPAHQWSNAEFEQLRLGYYVASLSTSSPSSGTASIPTTAASPPSSPSPTGEDFFTLLFQCLRSTVRKHQQLALETLLAHLQGLMLKDDNSLGDSTAATGAAKLCEEAVALRGRCLHGPNCGPFVFFLLEILASAGHPAIVELAATCVLLLLRSLPRGGTLSEYASSSLLERDERASLLTDAIGELGNPAGDAPGGDDEGEQDGDEKTQEGDIHGADATSRKEKARALDDAELPFSEVSELLRGQDARYGLEQLGFTSKVLATMHLLLYTPAGGDVNKTDKASVKDASAAMSQEEVDERQRHTEASFAEARLLPRHGQVLFLELLLCGGVGIGQRAACRRVAEDPNFLRWMEGQLSSVVLGHRSLGAVMELLCVLQHVAHAPVALRSLMRGGPGGDGQAKGTTPTTATTTTAAYATQQRQHRRFHETWLIFFIYVSSTAVKEVRTIRQAFTIVWSMLLLRMCVRQRGHNAAASTSATTTPAAAPMSSVFGLVHDVSDTLLADGMRVGGALALEMWFLQYVHADGCAAGTKQPGSLDSYFLDAARTALQLCRKAVGAGSLETAATAHGAYGSIIALSEADAGNEAVTSQEAAAAQRLLHELQWLSNAHFFATYITHMRQRSPAACYALGGSAVETQDAMRDVVRHVVMDPTRMKSAFARLTSPLLSASFSVWKTSSNAGPTESAKEAPPSSSPAFATDDDDQHGWVPAVQAVLRRWIPSATAGAPRNTGTTSPPTRSHTSNFNVTPSLSPRSVAVVRLAMEAAGVYANTRLAVALADVYPAVARDVVTGYAALLTHAFEEACLRLQDGAVVRLQVEELCTMAEAVRLLQRGGGHDRSNGTSTTADAAEPPSPYDREARIGAFFLLHGIAISKHCLDVVPLILPLLLFPCASHTPAVVPRSSVPDTARVPAEMPLLASLQSGIELTPVPVMLSNRSGNDSSSEATMAVTGAPRSWVLYPLYDVAFREKHLWAHWLRGLLGLHQRVKDVVGWDGVLSHTLLWMLTHRRALWAVESADEPTALAKAQSSREETDEGDAQGVSGASADALSGLLLDLCAVLHDRCAPAAGGTPGEGTPAAAMSASASRTLEISLTAYCDVSSEAGLPPLLHAVLAYVAAHCSARTALAALQVLLATPLLPSPAGINGGSCEELADAKSCGSSCFQHVPATAEVCAWLQSWSVLQGQQAQSAKSAYWCLDDAVSLVQLVGPHLGHGGWDADDELPVSNTPTSTACAWGADGLWCVRCLTEGLLRYYLQQRIATSGALSAMEKTVLRSTLVELEWFPSVLWPLVEI
ncbi:hypothetical protein ABB37_05950 [Leptomonas pyrrhocoris]|uniref:Uncharacterized protein n=1 Tax=Leptomonas pyrrhocoris TaxID=157538 RepID=A0A0M9FZ78_LEPPY|nr:hypothetical protein ABB37_05950 [Leptomonas pyrrhocoris]KPA78886.1 hypothetical protein ABB37_05950 [Leptomonas pyrrhocoris]|eukprot:XP_015657325.1 hypothetical protein ABB37_05950 [Leptomonas pyrrhocoris]